MATDGTFEAEQDAAMAAEIAEIAAASAKADKIKHHHVERPIDRARNQRRRKAKMAGASRRKNR